ncbi:hypothetical protein HPB48_020329 [Haemaphysalis longicornis]|uniref:Uncharacterized protein n=1 Tax=Haemaphysalis longicornis TaxID=44386 RepID=A0A9J6GSR0_HAELO|nr:hypothetical protein HPB48_020329 [Haemaphysalis longicornis]
MRANAYGTIGNHYCNCGMRGRALEAYLMAAHSSLEVDDVKQAEEYLEHSENVFKTSSWENVDERYLKLKRIAISRMRANIQLYYGNIDASLQEIKLAFQWLGRNIPKDYRKNASTCRVDEIEEEEFCLDTAARVFLNRRDPRVALDVSSHYWELVTCRNAPLFKKMPAIALVIESSHYVHIALKKQKKLEDTAIKDCVHTLEVDKRPPVSDLVAVLNTLIKIVEVRFLRNEISSAVDVGECACTHSKCREVLAHLRHVAEVAEDTVGMALYFGGLAELLVHQCVDSCSFRAQCYSSKKKTPPPYSVIAAVGQHGEVADGNCECPAGKVACNRLMGMLRTVALVQSKGFQEAPQHMACTDFPQQWRVPLGSAKK